ncbi:MAG: RHS repeat-associated core domain-containing protein [Bdellovibrionota bacterium]
MKYRTKRTTAQGGTVIYDLDANQDLTKQTFPIINGAAAAATVTYTRNSWRRIATLAYGGSTYTFTYDSLGNITDVVNSSTGHWTYTYNGFDLLTAADNIGTYLTLGYTDSSNPHSPTTITDGASRTWTRTYNAYGQVLTVAPPSGSSIGTTTYAYEENPSDAAFGYLRSITNGAGDVTTFDSYSPLGDVTSRTTSPSSGVTHTTTYSYDPSRRLLGLQFPDSTTNANSYTGRDLDSTIDEAGTEFDFTWKPGVDLLATESGPLSHQLSWNYTGDRQLSSFVDARSNTTNYTYGNAGEKKLDTYPDSSQRTYKYDSHGRFSSLTEPRGRIMTATYDGLSRITNWTFSSPSQTQLEYFYRIDGSYSSTNCYTGSATYAYTTGRQVDNVTYNYSNSGLTTNNFLYYTYNPDGTVATMQWKRGSTVVVTWTYTYDGAGRMTGVSNSFGESSTFAYDHEGKITTQTNGNGTTTSYGYYEPRGWVSSITHKLSGTPFASYSMEFDGTANTVGNITKVTELDLTTVDYTYDDLYRLTGETRTGTNSFSHTYAYDLAGNVTTLDGSTFATYDAANKFASLSGGTYSYDGAGNLTAVNVTGMTSGTFSYETREKMDNQTQGSTSIGYNYDPFGKRVLAKPGTTSSTYVWYIFDGDRLVGEVTTSGVKAAYTWGPDGIVSERVISGNKSRYFHFGPQRETRYLTDASGTVADSYLYTAYGVPVTSSGTDFNPHRYGGKVGYYSDGPLGLILATHRWYSPKLMRWMGRDPIEYEGGENLYGYANNNPVLFTDPDGLEPKSTLGGDDPGFSDPSIIKELKEKLKDPDLSQKDKEKIKRRIKELSRRPKGNADHHCDDLGDEPSRIDIPDLTKVPVWIFFLPFPGNPVWGFM